MPQEYEDDLTLKQMVRDIYHAIKGNEELGTKGIAGRLSETEGRVSNLEDGQKKFKWTVGIVVFFGGVVIAAIKFYLQTINK